jgi:hypothetical protein
MLGNTRDYLAVIQLRLRGSDVRSAEPELALVKCDVVSCISKLIGVHSHDCRLTCPTARDYSQSLTESTSNLQRANSACI